jgi:Ig-like domain CHU_C associated
MFQFLRPSAKNRALSSRLGSLILMFQRSPMVQIFFPEARMLGGAGLGEITKWTIATVAGLGAYDTVAGATAISQISPNSGASTVAATAGSGLSFVFQCTGSPAAPKSWSTTGLPGGLNHTNSTNSSIDSITGIPTVSGSFPVTVTAWRYANQAGSSFSKTFTINIAPAAVTAPGITGQPVSVTINSGGSATFSVSASGPSLGFQWYLGGSGDFSNPIVGANSSSYTTPGLFGDTAYWVQANNSAGSANSNTAIATVTVAGTVITPPSFTAQPASATINSGGTATFNVALGGSASNLQWYLGNTGDFSNPISGANSPGYTTPALNADTAYWVQASNSAGSANSNTVTVNVTITVITPPIALDPPKITKQPSATTVAKGKKATLRVLATNAASYQWYKGKTGNTGSPVRGATATKFTTPALKVSTSYWVRVSNAAGSANSKTRLVKVK